MFDIKQAMDEALARMDNSEIEIKKKFIEVFKVELDFKDDYSDLQVIIPLNLRHKHPLFIALDKYRWVHYSDHAEEMIVLNDKAVSLDLKEFKPISFL